jgi:hypothetical protein
MLKKLMVLLLLCLTIIIGGIYFILWPLALQYLTALNTVLQPAVENFRETVPALSPEVNLQGLLAVLPILGQIGPEGLTMLTEVAEGGITPEEAQQVLDLLRRELSAEQLTQLKALLNFAQ